HGGRPPGPPRHRLPARAPPRPRLALLPRPRRHGAGGDGPQGIAFRAAVVRFVFTVEDLARTRFAISPIYELVHSLVALRDPSHPALPVLWLRTLSGRLDGLALTRAVALIPPTGYVPDFLFPPPAGPLGDLAHDLATLRATPVARIRDEIGLFRGQ